MHNYSSTKHFRLWSQILVCVFLSSYRNTLLIRMNNTLHQINILKTIITWQVKKSKVGDHSRGWPEGSLFDSLLHQGVGEGATPFPGLLHFTLDPYLIMPSVKQGGIKYHFLSLWYDSTWDWTQVSWAIGEHSNRKANVRYYMTKTYLFCQNF